MVQIMQPAHVLGSTRRGSFFSSFPCFLLGHLSDGVWYFFLSSFVLFFSPISVRFFSHLELPRRVGVPSLLATIWCDFARLPRLTAYDPHNVSLI